MIYAHGFVGLVLFLNIFIQVRKQISTDFQKVSLWIILIMTIGSEMIVNFGIMTYFVYILTYRKNISFINLTTNKNRKDRWY